MLPRKLRGRFKSPIKGDFGQFRTSDSSTCLQDGSPDRGSLIVTSLPRTLSDIHPTLQTPKEVLNRDTGPRVAGLFVEVRVEALVGVRVGDVARLPGPSARRRQPRRAGASHTRRVKCRDDREMMKKMTSFGVLGERSLFRKKRKKEFLSVSQGHFGSTRRCADSSGTLKLSSPCMAHISSEPR